MKKRNIFSSVICIIVLIAALACGSVIGAFAADNSIPNYAEGDKFNVTTSSTISDAASTNRYPSSMLDGDTTTYWCSAWVNENDPKVDEFFLLDFKEVKKINSLSLTALGGGAMFPCDFEIVWSTTNEVEIPLEGFKFTDRVPDEGVNTFNFDGLVARYVKVKMTKVMQVPGSACLVGIAEADADITDATPEEIAAANAKDAQAERPKVINDPVIPYNVETSSFLEGTGPAGEALWAASNLTDGNIGTQWCSEWTNNTSPDEPDGIWVTTTFEDAKKVSGWIISTQNVCFPVDFKFQYSFNGTDFIDIPNAQWTGFDGKTQSKYVFAFENPQVATVIRIFITKKSADPSGNYLVQFADIDVRGFDPTEEEVTAAEKAFEVAIGQVPEDPNKKPDLIPVTPDDKAFYTKSCSAATLGGALATLTLTAAAALVLKRK